LNPLPKKFSSLLLFSYIFFKDGRAVTFVGASIAQVFPLTLGESQAEREKKLSGKERG
jgi:hypothetical protein